MATVHIREICTKCKAVVNNGWHDLPTYARNQTEEHTVGIYQDGPLEFYLLLTNSTFMLLV